MSTKVRQIDLRLEPPAVCLRRDDAQRILMEQIEADLEGQSVVVDVTRIGATSASFIDGILVGIVVQRHAESVAFVGARHRVAQYIAGAAERRGILECVILSG